ncbi:MAG: alkaline phosphatase family protein [Marinilabiliales bacterium]
MSNYYKHIILLFKRLLAAIITFQLSRILFLLFNYNGFDGNFYNALKILFYGFRFDWYTIVLINSVFIILHILPGNFKNNFNFQKFLKYLFFITNAAALLLNFIDIEYYKFIGKRSTSDFFTLIITGSEVWDQLPIVLKNFWYIIITWFFTVFILVLFYPVYRKVKFIDFGYKTKDIIYQSIIAIIIIMVFFFTARGFGYKSTNILSGLNLTSSKNLPFLLNTPFTMIQTLKKSELEPKFTIPDNKLNEIYSPVYYDNDNQGNKKNVVILIIKNLSKDFSSYFTKSENTHTPFLDSLFEQGLVFTNSYANGNMTLKAYTSVFNGVPSLMKSPYIFTEFSTNKIHSIGETLKKHGYNTFFFYGDKNDVARLKPFSKITGFNYYYGFYEYPDKNEHYDRTNGIYDEDFLDFMAEKLSKTKEPFFAGFINVSTAHPFIIPEKYQNKFSNENEILNCIEYTDFSLKKFFDKISNEPWYNNTLFIITSDHNCFNYNIGYFDRFGIYRIPLLFYCPSDTNLKGNNPVLCQHVDIFPSILDYTGISDTIISFGKSVFDEYKNHIIANYKNNYYEFLINDYFIEFETNHIIGLYKKDNPETDLANATEYHNLKIFYEILINAYIQQYNNRIIFNKLTEINLKN